MNTGCLQSIQISFLNIKFLKNAFFLFLPKFGEQDFKAHSEYWPFWLVSSVFFFLTYLPSSFLGVNPLLILQWRPTCFPPWLTVLLPAILSCLKRLPRGYLPISSIHGQMSTLQTAVPAGNVTVPQLIVPIPSSTGQSAPQCPWKYHSDAKSAPTSDAALCWKGWSSCRVGRRGWRRSMSSGTAGSRSTHLSRAPHPWGVSWDSALDSFYAGQTLGLQP